MVLRVPKPSVVGSRPWQCRDPHLEEGYLVPGRGKVWLAGYQETWLAGYRLTVWLAGYQETKLSLLSLQETKPDLQRHRRE